MTYSTPLIRFRSKTWSYLDLLNDVKRDMIRSVWQQKGQLIGQFLSKTHRRLPMADTRSAAKQAVQASFRNRIKSMKARSGTGAGLVSPQEGVATEVAIAPTAKSNDPLVRYHASTYRDSLNGQGPASKSPLDLPPADADEPKLRDEDLPFDLSAVNLINPQVEYHDDDDEESMTYPQARAQADARLGSVVVTGTPVVEEPESIAADDESESSRERGARSSVGGGGSHSHSGSSARPTESSPIVSLAHCYLQRVAISGKVLLETDSLLSHNRDLTLQRPRPFALRSVLTNNHRAPPLFPSGCASRVRRRRARRARPSRPVRRSGRRDCRLRRLHMATLLGMGLPISATSKRHDSSSVVPSTRMRGPFGKPVSTRHHLSPLWTMYCSLCKLLTFTTICPNLFFYLRQKERCVRGGVLGLGRRRRGGGGGGGRIGIDLRGRVREFRRRREQPLAPIGDPLARDWYPELFAHLLAILCHLVLDFLLLDRHLLLSLPRSTLPQLDRELRFLPQAVQRAVLDRIGEVRFGAQSFEDPDGREEVLVVRWGVVRIDFERDG